MNKPLALFDIDKTMFNGLSYFPLLDSQIGEGLVEPAVGEDARGAMEMYKGQSLSYESFVKRLLDIYASGLEGKTVEAVQTSTNNFFNNSHDFFGYVRPTIELLSKTHEVVLVTGSSNFTAGAVANLFGVATHISTQLGSEQGMLNGDVKTYLATRHDKKEAIQHLTDTHPYAGSFGFGDSEGDIEMLRAVENAICIRPTTGLAELAAEKGWSIVDSQNELASHDGLAAVKLSLRNSHPL